MSFGLREGGERVCRVEGGRWRVCRVEGGGCGCVGLREEDVGV